jgi:hypothetical protein
MFIDVKIMNTDIQVVLGDEGPQADSDSIADGLAILYKEIAGIYYLYSWYLLRTYLLIFYCGLYYITAIQIL